jgi:hypothetical protein
MIQLAQAPFNECIALLSPVEDYFQFAVIRPQPSAGANQ